MERWVDIPGYEGRYEISDLGNVRSLDRRSTNKLTGGTSLYKGKIVPGWKTDLGYHRVALYDSQGKKLNHFVHRLVLLAFVGPEPDNMNALHGPNGNSDNSLFNLKWGTQKENLEDQRRDGVLRHGSSHGHAKLNEEKAREIFKRSQTEVNLQLAVEYGVSVYQIWSIKNRKTWKHATEGL